ncbi:immunoglobulin E-set [Flagelloscypha sp. PMI_526]|nr:immunoglobulin E-set [Flagelloscypha sp. PMI_526]
MADHDDDFKPSFTPGYKPAGAAKSADEYAQLDAEDESLARWKASLGITAGAGGGGSGPKVTVFKMELHSPTLPPGKKIELDLTDPARVKESTKKHPVVIKEGVEYNVSIVFKVNHSIISGVRYIQVVKRAGVKVDKLEQMLGSYGPPSSRRTVHEKLRHRGISIWYACTLRRIPRQESCNRRLMVRFTLISSGLSSLPKSGRS